MSFFYYNDDGEDGGAAAGLVIIMFIILIPFIPAGDVGLYVAKQITSKPMVIVNIIFWVGFVVLYGMLLSYIAKNFLQTLHKVTLIFLAYLQGIIFAFIVNEAGIATLSGAIVEITTNIFKFLISR